MGRMSAGCGETVWSVWGGCWETVEGVGRLPGGCGQVVWRV